MIAQMVKEKILIIDDELGPRESLRILLKHDFDVFCADSVDKGLELLRREAPDLVVMDIRMPGKTGIDGLREIRAIDPVVSIVMLTGFGALETAQQALRLGANDYLNKPFDTGDMRRVVGQYVRRTRLERKRAGVMQELQDINTRLSDDLAEKERLASIGQSSAEFVHDLRNPLMIVTGYVDLLSRQMEKARDMMGGEFSSVMEYMEVIEENVRRCCDLSNSWQRLSKSDTAAFALTPIAQVMDDMLAATVPLASVSGVQIEFRSSRQEAFVLGSRMQLLRALHNLAANAIQACAPATGCVNVGCDIVGQEVEIRVEDNGSGMAPDVLARMFEPHFTTKAEGKGTGLGTVIAKKIIQEHKGDIAVQSEVGRGTTVTVRLPLAQVTAGAEASRV
jgi:signal transduction histidine kinase